MGYYVMTTGLDAVIPADRAEAALAEVKRLNTDPRFEQFKTGGSYERGVKSASWFAWMPESFDEFDTLESFFIALGFDGTRTTEAGDVILGDYDSKAGSEDFFLDRLAEYFTEGSWLEWRGEEGEQWRMEVEGGKWKKQSAITVWQ